MISGVLIFGYGAGLNPFSAVYSGSCPSSVAGLPLLSASQAASAWNIVASGTTSGVGLAATYGPFNGNINTLPALNQYPGMGAFASDNKGDPPVYVYVTDPLYVYGPTGACELRTYTTTTTTATTTATVATTTGGSGTAGNPLFEGVGAVMALSGAGLFVFMRKEEQTT